MGANIDLIYLYSSGPITVDACTDLQYTQQIKWLTFKEHYEYYLTVIFTSVMMWEQIIWGNKNIKRD